MSLDVYLYLDNKTIDKKHSGIFIREDGQNKEISREEWDKKFPDKEPIVIQAEEDNIVFSANITHNLFEMAGKAKIYKYLWRPAEIGLKKANQLIIPLTQGLTLLKSKPMYFKTFNPPNNWGSYEGLIKFVEEYLEACKKYPEAKVDVWR